MTFYAFTPISRNAKVGPIPVVTSDRSTCPTTCPLRSKGCYAETGPLSWHWKKLDKDGLTFDKLLYAIRRLPRGQMWRYGQAGDLPVDDDDVRALARANAGRPVIAYSHTRRPELFREVAQIGFTINQSADSLEEADELGRNGLPTVVVLHEFYQRMETESLREYRDRIGGMSFQTPGGRRVAICPATYLETTCSACGVCSRPRPDGTIIGFPLHGTRKGVATRTLETTPWILTSSRSFTISAKTSP